LKTGSKDAAWRCAILISAIKTFRKWRIGGDLMTCLISIRRFGHASTCLPVNGETAAEAPSFGGPEIAKHAENGVAVVLAIDPLAHLE